jgi:hypothetical protein
MRRSTDWYRQQSALAERKYQAIVWGRAAPQSAAHSLYPKHSSSVRPSEIRHEPGVAPNTLASALYPTLKEQ